MSLFNQIVQEAIRKQCIRESIPGIENELMNMLGLSEEDVGRYRGVEIKQAKDGEIKIVIRTRNGGGNRKAFREKTKFMQAHPNYLYDKDESFDCTYARYTFSVPEKYRERAVELLKSVKVLGVPQKALIS